MMNNLPVVLVIDSQKASRDTIATVLHSHAVRLREADNAQDALSALDHHNPDVILVDPFESGQDRPDLVGRLRERLPDVPVIVVTEQQETRLVVEAMRQGVFDYLHKPVNAGALVLSVNRALEGKRLKDELRVLRGQLSGRQSLQVSMGDSDTVRKLVGLLDKIAPTPYTVLIEGESGSGKELVARAIHDMSRVPGQFVAIDCGAIPENLFESELFGHTKGAFTGAGRDKTGFFEAADNGTLFLDEVCNLSYLAQQKLLRVIEERKVQRLGATTPRPVNVRIVAASNRSLDREVEERRFRVDLLHRLKEVFVKVPPLRERPEDIGYLASRFLDEFRTGLGIGSNSGLAPAALQALAAYQWPGNVRELKNVMRQAALVTEDGQPVSPEHLPAHVTAGIPAATADRPAVDDDNPLTAMPDASLADIVGAYTRALEKRVIEQAIRDAGGNKAAAAKRLRIDYTTMHRKRKQLGIE